MKLILSILLLFLIIGDHATAQIAVKGDMVYTMAGNAIENGVVLIKDGKIEDVGDVSKINIPEGYRTFSGKIVTPGLVDAHATVGLTGIYNQKHDQDQLDKSSPIQPELRAIDAYNPREALVAYLSSMGVTTVHTGHAPGALISGQTLIAKTHGKTIDEVVIDDATMLALSLGKSVTNNFESPGSRAKEVAMLRSELIKAQEYLKKKQRKDISKQPDRDLKMEALARLLDGELKALVTVHRSNDIMTAIRLAKEFNLKLVLDGVAESYLLIDEIKESGAELILHPSMARKSGELVNGSMETASILTKAGIPIAIQSGYESYVPKVRVILYEAAMAARFGLPFDDALRAITINPARILGIDDRVGTLEKGKDADLVIFDGDPFEYTTHVCTVIINGKVVKDECQE